MRVLKCPPTFPTDFYWYGGKRSKPGRPPKHVQKQLEEVDAEVEQLNTVLLTVNMKVKLTISSEMICCLS